MRVLLRHRARIRRLLNVTISERDGSIIVVFPREGSGPRSTSRIRLDDGVEDLRQDPVEARRGLKITLHSSGRVNRGEGRPPIFIEPLWALTEPALIAARRIDLVAELDPFDKAPADDDLVLDVPEGFDGPASFELIVFPAETRPSAEWAIWWTAPAGPTLVVRQASYEALVPADLADTFMSFFPPHGTRSEQQVEEDLALIGYFRALRGEEFTVPIGPNGAGHYRVIFPVRMRVPPIASIRPVDPDLSVEVVDQSSDPRTNRVQIRFLVRERATGQVVLHRVDFADMEFDAELRVFAP